MDGSPASETTRRPRRRSTEQRSLAGIISRHGRDSVRAQQARRDYNALALEDAIRDTLAEAPPLTAAQRTRLAALLRPTADADGSVTA